jgi:Protein of unknown function (DUF2799)
VVDWRTIGYEDGVAGRSGGAIGRHRKACAAAGVTTDLDAYQNGRVAGLREYCQPDTGYAVGSSGRNYPAFCAVDLEPAFRNAYDDGYELHGYQSRLSTVRSRLAQARSELERIDHDMISTSAALMDSNTTREGKAQLLLDVKQMVERRQRLRDELPLLESDQRRLQYELDQYQSQVAQRR